MRLRARLALGVLPLVAVGSGCTATQHTAWENWTATVTAPQADGPAVVLCWWDAAAERSYGDAAHTRPCQANWPTRLDLVLATDQDDDVEAYRDRCATMGDSELIIYVNAPHEEWVCEGVDY